jgi:hypothetical protein
VIWPDPKKDPTLEPAIQKLWDQLDSALSKANDVLVMGHSLHDDLLVERIRKGAGKARKAVAVHNPADRARAGEVFSEATIVGIDFGPEPKLEPVKEWGGKK